MRVGEAIFGPRNVAREPVRSRALRDILPAMAGVWRKTLIYLGLVEDDELDGYALRGRVRRARAERAPTPQGARRARQPGATPS